MTKSINAGKQELIYNILKMSLTHYCKNLFKMRDICYFRCKIIELSIVYKYFTVQMFSGIRKLFGQILKVSIIYLEVTETIIFTILSRIRIKLKNQFGIQFSKTYLLFTSKSFSGYILQNIGTTRQQGLGKQSSLASSFERLMCYPGKQISSL